MYEHSADRDGKKNPVLWLKKHYFAIIKGAHDAGSRGFTERRASDLSKLGNKKRVALRLLQPEIFIRTIVLKLRLNRSLPPPLHVIAFSQKHQAPRACQAAARTKLNKAWRSARLEYETRSKLKELCSAISFGLDCMGWNNTWRLFSILWENPS